MRGPIPPLILDLKPDSRRALCARGVPKADPIGDPAAANAVDVDLMVLWAP